MTHLDIVLLGHETMADARASARLLEQLGHHARKLLEECVEKSGVSRVALSKAAAALETAGFIFVRDTGNIWQPSFQLQPSLAGEEALEVLEHLQSEEAP